MVEFMFVVVPYWRAGESRVTPDAGNAVELAGICAFELPEERIKGIKQPCKIVVIDLSAHHDVPNSLFVDKTPITMDTMGEASERIRRQLDQAIEHTRARRPMTAD